MAVGDEQLRLRQRQWKVWRPQLLGQVHRQLRLDVEETPYT
jgi:hypothetical protein